MNILASFCMVGNGNMNTAPFKNIWSVDETFNSIFPNYAPPKSYHKQVRYWLIIKWEHWDLGVLLFKYSPKSQLFNHLPVVKVFPHVLRNYHNQIVDVVVFIRRDPWEEIKYIYHVCTGNPFPLPKWKLNTDSFCVYVKQWSTSQKWQPCLSH